MSNHVKDDRSPNPGLPWPETITESPSMLFLFLLLIPIPMICHAGWSGICHRETPRTKLYKTPPHSTGPPPHEELIQYEVFDRGLSWACFLRLRYHWPVVASRMNRPNKGPQGCRRDEFCIPRSCIPK